MYDQSIVDQLVPIRCGICSGEAVFVNHGDAIGSYWYCRACKKEEKEWGKGISTTSNPENTKSEIELPTLEVPPQFSVYYYITVGNNEFNKQVLAKI